MQDRPETIFAPASALGRVAVAIVRISGPAAGLAITRLAGLLPKPRKASLAALTRPVDGLPIDQALLLYFPKPHSFTGEDVIEIHHHGSIAVSRSLMDALSDMPELRPAGPGEFTKQAFLNGKLDLTQAEGLADLIDASTMSQARAALRQLSGVHGRHYTRWREQILQALALLEAEIDFSAEEEVPEALWSSVAKDLEAVMLEMRRHLDDSHKGERLRRGIVVAVIGAPNVGKSSLVNTLARREVAIVTPMAGTTRDIIEVALDLDGLPVTLLDTAGLRDTDDPIECEGINRARARAAAADVRLVVIDNPEEQAAQLEVASPSLLVLNKADHWPASIQKGNLLAVSATSGQGIPALIGALAALARDLVPGDETVLITRSRHRSALADGAAALERALLLGLGADIALLTEEVRLAAKAIGKVTGVVGIEDVLDRIFGTFCIGK